MRLNKYIALSTGISRRAADTAITDGRVLINSSQPQMGQQVRDTDIVTLDGHRITPPKTTQTIILNKPVGYVCSRAGQTSRTVYDLLPEELHHLKPVGRLDKNSSGLLLMTNDGDLAHQLTHPSFRKVKVYEIELYKPLAPLHKQMISDHGIALEDGPSKFDLERFEDGNDHKWTVRMHEGRNRQIRRTFQALGYEVKALHRTTFGSYSLQNIPEGSFKSINN
jgi:23S rRNA pseudouridine2605 synthase